MVPLVKVGSNPQPDIDSDMATANVKAGASHTTARPASRLTRRLRLE